MVDTRKLALETKAAQALREKLAADLGDDTDLIRDTIEGETSLHELIAAVTLDLAAVEGEKDGIEIAIAKLRERLSRHCRRAELIRAALAAAMDAAELASLKTPAATLSMRTSPPRLEIVGPNLIPAIYLTQPAPVPDKNAIKAAIKSGEDIPGCVLSNQPPALQVRFT